jgi:hypothetical protein
MANGEDYSDLMGQIKNIRRMQKERALDLATKIPARGMYRAAGYTPAQLEQFAPMPGKFLPSDAAAYNKDLLAAFNTLTEASAAPDASEEERMKQRIIFHKTALQQGVELLNKRAQLATDVEKTRLNAQVKKTNELIDAIDTAEGVGGSSGSKKSQSQLGLDAAKSVISKVEAGTISSFDAVKGVMGLKSDEAVEAYKKHLKGAYTSSYMDPNNPDARAGDTGALFDPGGAIDSEANRLKEAGMFTEQGGSVGSGAERSEEDQAILDKFGGLAGRKTLLMDMERQINELNASTGGELQAQLAQVAMGSTGGRTSDIMEASEMLVGKDMSPEDKAQFQQNIESQKSQLLDKMLDPGAEGPIKQAKMALMQDPNFQNFKKDMGIQTDEFGLRALRQKYRTQNVASRRADRDQMKRLRTMGTEAHPVRTAAIKNISDTVEKPSAPKSDSAEIASATLDKRDVTVKTDSTPDGY